MHSSFFPFCLFPLTLYIQSIPDILSTWLILGNSILLSSMPVIPSNPTDFPSAKESRSTQTDDQKYATVSSEIPRNESADAYLRIHETPEGKWLLEIWPVRLPSTYLVPL